MNKRLLVVDDDTIIQTILAAVLEKAGYTVTLASDGQQALAALTGDQPDLILTDHMMPNLTGGDLCTMLAHRVPYEPIPTIIMSGNPEIDLPLDCRYDAFISKPFLIGDLLALLQHWLAETSIGTQATAIETSEP